ncbi:MAG TPA: hypothetical protein PLN52_12105 [Opitutaceae bacterium]|nr:hypothetical protein [Opitutaceae bacterium]
MSDSRFNFPAPDLLRWLVTYTRFPAHRLPTSAETLLCLAAAAESTEAGAAAGSDFALHRREGEKESAMRAHALRRSRVHFKCDNSAKV